MLERKGLILAKQIVGFDIGEKQVKMAVISGKKLKAAVAVDLPDNLVRDGEIVSMEAMADFLREAAKENGVPRADAAIVLPETLVFTKNVVLPVMTERQLLFNLPYEFRDYLTEEKSKYFFDYSVLEILRDEENRPTEMRLFACAALKSTIADYRAMLHRAGFRLKTAVPAEWALGSIVRRCIAATGEHGREYCLLDLGHRGSRFHIFHDGEYVNTRGIELGGADIDRVISECGDVDIHIANTYKLTNYNGILERPELTELYNRLEVEIMKAVNFYNYNNRESTLEELYLCGGCAAIQPLVGGLGQLSNLRIRSAAELLSAEDAVDAPWLYLTAIGCAMKE